MKRAGNGSQRVSNSEDYALTWEFFNIALGITVTNSTAVLTWPIYPDGFALQSAWSMYPPAPWAATGETPTVMNGTNRLEQPVGANGTFFRLSRPWPFQARDTGHASHSHITLNVSDYNVMSCEAYKRLLRAAWIGITCLGFMSLQAKSLEVSYDRESAKLSVDATGQTLQEVLGQLAAKTGWDIFIEPNANPVIETRFEDVGVGRGIELLVGRMNYALVPQSDGPTKLFVFQTSRDQATLRVSAAGDEKPRITIRRVGNELIVTVEPGTDIEALAKRLGAKVTGHLEGANTYRLEFEDEAAAESARTQLASEPGVKGVEYNYVVDRPTPPQSIAQGLTPPVKLSLNPPPADGGIVVGLVDTAVQTLGGDLDKFLLPSKSVAGETALSTDRLTHGTSMAETILRSIEQCSGSGTSVQILPVDIYGAKPTSTSFDVAVGIITAVNKGANIINLSLGSYGGAPYLQEVIREASQAGIPIFAAAGNEPVTAPVYPAAYSEVIAVTATQNNQLAPYANRGAFVDMVAPGSSVVYFDGQPYQINGTSTATAYASGQAACVADRQGLSPSEAAALIAQQHAVSFGPGP